MVDQERPPTTTKGYVNDDLHQGIEDPGWFDESGLVIERVRRIA